MFNKQRLRVATRRIFIYFLIVIIIIPKECDQQKFKVAGLLPQLKYFHQSNQCFKSDNTPWIDALTAINFAKDKLSNYFSSYYNCNIDLDIRDTECDVAYTTKSFFDFANDTKQTLLMFGGSCDILQPVAESVKFFNLTILSYTETNPQFSEQSKYKGFYRLVPSEEQHNQLRIFLLKKYKWKRMGTIYLSKAKYTLAHNMLIRELEDQRLINSTMTRSINENTKLDEYEAILDEFKKNDIYIIIGIFDINTTIRLYCQIYKKNMFGDNYQWIILGTSMYNLKNIYFNQTNSDCTYDELLIALNGTLQTRVVQYSYDYYRRATTYSTKRQQASDTSDMVIKNLTDLYMDSFFKECSPKNRICFYSSCFHAYAYDLLLTILKLIGSLIENKKFICNRDGATFERDFNWFQSLNDAFNNISFTGVTGHVKFVNGSRIGEIKLEQLKTITNESSSKLIGNEVLIGIYDQHKAYFHKINEIFWHNNKIPNDNVTKITQLYKIYTGVYIGMSSFATIGIFLAFGFLIFNIKYRNHRFIKMSSPNLNNLIICGCLLSYMNIYFLGLYEGLVSKTVLSHICAIRVWLISIGFTFAFGSMFSKTYRVHAILTNTQLRKKVIKDYKLFGIVIFLLIIDVLILANWQIFDPLRITRKRSDHILSTRNIITEENVCESNYETVWLAGLFSYKGLLIIFGCFFAYETRHVTITALNDSRHIGICVYNVLLMCTTGSAIAFIVKNRNIAFILITLFIFTCTTITLCLVFIPKVLEVIKDPLGKKKPKTKPTFKRNSLREVYSNNVSNENMETKLSRVSAQLDEKRHYLTQLNSKIDTLTKQLNSQNELSSDLLELIDLNNKTSSSQFFTINSESNVESSQFLDSKKASTEDDDDISDTASINEESKFFIHKNDIDSIYNIQYTKKETNEKANGDGDGDGVGMIIRSKRNSIPCYLKTESQRVPQIKVTNSVGSEIEIEYQSTTSVNDFLHSIGSKLEKKFQSVRFNTRNSFMIPSPRRFRSASMVPCSTTTSSRNKMTKIIETATTTTTTESNNNKVTTNASCGDDDGIN